MDASRNNRTVTRRSRVLLLFAPLFCVVLVACAVIVPRASDAATRSLTVTPATGLQNQVVLVSWSGFTPTDGENNTVTIVQCKKDPKSVADCSNEIRPPSGHGSGVQNGVTDANGNGLVFFEVKPAFDLDLGCSTTAPCTILAFENDGTVPPPDALPATAAVAPIEFAPTQADCPPVSTPDVRVAGEGSTVWAFDRWAASLCTASPSLAVDYTEQSSQEGGANLTAGLIDSALTSVAIPVPASQQAMKYAYAPVDVTSVVVAFNVADTVTKAPIKDMVLTPRLLAMLIAGTQSRGPGTHLFQDPEFIALNPGHSWPVNTQPPLLRAELNADARFVTNWLQQDADARRFLDGNDPIRTVDPFWKNVKYPTDQFKALDENTIGQYLPRKGTRENARRLFNFQPPGDGVTVTPLRDGLLGVMDAVTAIKFGLPMAKLVPADSPGAPAVAPDVAGVTAGYQAMTKTSDDGSVRQPAVKAGNGAYPLTKIDYAMVPTAGISAAKAKDFAMMLRFAAGKGQEPSLLPAGYLPLPDDAKEQSAQVAATLDAVTDPPPATAPPANGDPDDTFVPGGSDSFDSGSGFDSGFTDDSGFTSGDFPTDAQTAAAAAAAKEREARKAAERAKPISNTFLGGQGRWLLPIVLLLGVLALLAGPVMWFLLRKDPHPAGAAGEGGQGEGGGP